MKLHKLRIEGGDVWLDDFKLAGVFSVIYDYSKGDGGAIINVKLEVDTSTVDDTTDDTEGV